jgi:hypothetical protein
MQILKELMPGGALSYEMTDSAWVEDPILYRSSDFLCGVVSHESEGALELTPVEVQAFEASGFPARPEGRWVGPPPPRS